MKVIPPDVVKQVERDGSLSYLSPKDSSGPSRPSLQILEQLQAALDKKGKGKATRVIINELGSEDWGSYKATVCLVSINIRADSSHTGHSPLPAHPPRHPPHPLSRSHNHLSSSPHRRAPSRLDIRTRSMAQITRMGSGRVYRDARLCR